MKLYDGFFIWNELDLIEIRLETLYPHVDHFILVETSKTHNGQDKPFYFDENKDKFKKYLDKIIHIKGSDCPPPGDNGWGVENFQRNCIARGLKDAAPDDIILISDLDEIPNPQNFPFLRSSNFKQGEAYAFVHLHYNYYVNIYSHLNPAQGTVAVKKGTLDKFNPQHLRNIKNNIPRLHFGGWHLSWMGGPNRVRNKFLTSCDVIDKSEIPDTNEIKARLVRRLKEGQFNIRHDHNHPVIFVKDPYLPACLTKEKYPDFFLEDIDEIANDT